MKFRDYGLDVLWKRQKEQGYYEYHEVEKNFYKVIDALGEGKVWFSFTSSCLSLKSA